MDYADQTPRTDRWSTGSAPTADATLTPGDEATPGGEVDLVRVADPDGEAFVVMRASVTSGFLVELAKAMHAAADQERERIATVVAEEGAAHVERARARASVEAEELRRFADEDLQQINEWSATEIKRIRTEAARRADERRVALAEYIHQHEAIIDTEIQGVDGALADYRVTLGQFFSELTASSDPADIARRAGTLPPPPDLDDVRANARAAAVARLADTTASDDDSDDDSDDSHDEDESSTDEAAPAGSPDVETALVGVMDVSDAEPEPVAVGAGSSGQPGPAARLLRTIATWTGPSDRVERRASYEADE